MTGIRAKRLRPTTLPRWQHSRLLALDLGALIRLVTVEGGARAMHTEESCDLDDPTEGASGR
jgi:hypothetical protein